MFVYRFGIYQSIVNRFNAHFDYPKDKVMYYTNKFCNNEFWGIKVGEIIYKNENLTKQKIEDIEKLMIFCNSKLGICRVNNKNTKTKGTDRKGMCIISEDKHHKKLILPYYYDEDSFFDYIEENKNNDLL